MSESININDLLSAGAHFGHKTSKWHPKMKPYIHSKKRGIHILDLTKTIESLEEVRIFIDKLKSTNKQLLYVGTKRQAKGIIKEAADRAKQPYINERWLGGTLTNWSTIETRVKHLKSLVDKMASGELASSYSKLEVQRYQEEIDSLQTVYGGIVNMAGLPGALFVVDIVKESIAIDEANKLNIPVIAMVDSNADPSKVDYPIPANDDAVRSIQLIVDYVTDLMLAKKD